MSDRKLKLTIDGTEIEAEPGATILAAADAAEIYIPRLCSHPDLSAVDPALLEPWPEVWQGPRRLAGAGGGVFEGCGLCLVEVTGPGGPSDGAEAVRACHTEAADGMAVVTASAAIAKHRAEALRRIFALHPHACLQCAQQAGCSQEPCSTNVDKPERCCPEFHDCELRRVAEYVGIPADTTRYRPAGAPTVDREPLFIREHDLCIGCLRCVRICRELRQIDALGFVLAADGRPVVGTRAETLEESGCHWCLSCVEVCPTGTLRLKAESPLRDGDPVAPCVAGCPAGIDIPRYLREIRRGEFARAEAVVRSAAPLPRVLGQVCFHPCEDACLRAEIGSEPLAICALKRAANEHAAGPEADAEAREPRWRSHLPAAADSGKSVGIVGAGPAGLSAAWFLRLKGHAVVVYDAQPTAGGWLADGLPGYRLDAAALAADVADIAGLGVQFRLGVQIGADLDWQALQDRHDAVLIAVGARRPKPLPCPGVDLPGIENGLDLLRRLRERPADQPSLAGNTVVVIGGGNVAIDVARSAVRLGPAAVHLYCLEERDQMPAHDWEIDDAEAEGVAVHAGWGPACFNGGKAVEQVVFRKCLRVFDDRGRFAPRFAEDTTTSQPADRVLLAIGQEPVLDFLDGAEGVPAAVGPLPVDKSTLQLGGRGVFAAGEVVTGPASVVDAVAKGRRAAAGIDRFLGGDGEVSCDLLDDTVLDPVLDGLAGFTTLKRTPRRMLEPARAVTGFDLIEGGYLRGEAVTEAGRCLRCDLRLALRQNPHPPAPWAEFCAEAIAAVPPAAGVYRLLDEKKEVYAIKGVDNLRSALGALLDTAQRARYFLVDEDPMFSKRESELIQEYLQQHGCMPPGEGDDDLDDLF